MVLSFSHIIIKVIEYKSNMGDLKEAEVRYLNISATPEDSGKKFDTMANVSILAGNPMSVVMENTNLWGMKYCSV